MAEPQTLDLARRALTMDESTVAEILTWTDEPELIRALGQTAPVFSDADVAAARLANAWEVARMMNDGELQ